MATTTAQDLIKGALTLIGVRAEGETPNADQTTDALARLNEFVDALDTHQHAKSALATFADLSTSYTLPKGWQRMLRYNLAKILAPEYGRPLDPSVDDAARESLADVKRMTIQIDPIAIPLFGSGGIYDVNTDEIL